MPDLAYIDGAFIPLDQARVPVNDRALYYADAVYEVCATYGKKVFLLDDHLDRLERSLRGLRIGYELDRAFLADVMAEGIRRCGHDEVLIYLQISRGVAPRDDKTFPAGAQPTLFMTFRRKPTIAAAKRARGIEVILHPDERWAHCDYKTIMLLPNVLARQKAADMGRDDAIFFDPATKAVHEATSANIFVVRGGRIATPEQGPKVLSGTVRRYVIDLARRNGMIVEERPVSVGELLGADEVFLTGTTTEILAVVRVDDTVIGDGTPGPLTRKLSDLFLESVRGAK